jgi:4-hydroxybenzoate polyprenyltransferase
MAYAAVLNRVPALAWAYLVVNLFWVVAYDTEYAMVDRDDDVRLGLRTSAIAFGRFDVPAVALCYVLYLAGMAWAGSVARLGWVYYTGLVLAALIAAYHVWLIRGREREACFRAFLHNHWLGLTVFAAVALDYAVRHRAWPSAL